ncbi:transcription elongation factor GreA [Candidatus Uhrbacteria bacterium]|nr:transcription elongation factor GreA [Candidatus Uhrbacteria bacterium]
MRLPQRRSQQLSQANREVDLNVTKEAYERLKRTLDTLQKVERPKIVQDLSIALTYGDFSENAEYQAAKAALSRIDGRIFGLQERIKHAIIIEEGSENGIIRMGSTVVVSINGKEREYQILGPQEANPLRGKISYKSPLGAALLGHASGDRVEYVNPDGEKLYVEIKNIF